MLRLRVHRAVPPPCPCLHGVALKLGDSFAFYADYREITGIFSD
jgi:hypothetical protein